MVIQSSGLLRSMMTILRLLRMAKLCRLTRLAKLLRAVPELIIIVKARVDLGYVFEHLL